MDLEVAARMQRSIFLPFAAVAARYVNLGERLEYRRHASDRVTYRCNVSILQMEKLRALMGFLQHIQKHKLGFGFSFLWLLSSPAVPGSSPVC